MNKIWNLDIDVNITIKINVEKKDITSNKIKLFIINIFHLVLLIFLERIGEIIRSNILISRIYNSKLVILLP